MDDLLVAQSRLRHWIPVHHAFTTINQAFVEQIDESIYYAIVVFFIHSETRPRPITARPQFLELIQDDAPVLMGPVPCVAQKFIPA